MEYQQFISFEKKVVLPNIWHEESGNDWKCLGCMVWSHSFIPDLGRPFVGFLVIILLKVRGFLSCQNSFALLRFQTGFDLSLN
jgi:hypothetical protein